ncbi:hypothetical protein A2U01_0115888, partial [Trifolium medium]|nr:hypothetical protein [Trifolium medium]
MATQGQKVA